MAKILVVEDDIAIAEGIRDWLVNERHVVDVVGAGPAGLDLMTHYEFDVVVLDWQLPGLTGVDVCQQFRKTGGSTPILMLTAKSAITDKEMGFGVGADDYLTKPFDPRELSLRIKALLRRPSALGALVLQIGDIIIERERFRVLVGGVEVRLLPREFAILELLMMHPGEPFNSEAIVNRLWSTETESSPDAVRVHITRLRSKLAVGNRPSPIQTVHGLGYRFQT